MFDLNNIKDNSIIILPNEQKELIVKDLSKNFPHKNGGATAEP